ncbi:hypothetical protein PIB30_091786 [Stylosanthes scabra]|uniref:Uncharacterized protein n=1 Tax=Stylosanthes scabra TaxID=79078 RepID=A0ABU6YU82_9FABA|nr:hypothetical protein [Stylosanthes scabra]
MITTAPLLETLAITTTILTHGTAIFFKVLKFGPCSRNAIDAAIIPLSSSGLSFSLVLHLRHSRSQHLCQRRPALSSQHRGSHCYVATTATSSCWKNEERKLAKQETKFESKTEEDPHAYA